MTVVCVEGCAGTSKKPVTNSAAWGGRFCGFLANAYNKASCKAASWNGGALPPSHNALYFKRLLARKCLRQREGVAILLVVRLKAVALTSGGARIVQRFFGFCADLSRDFGLVAVCIAANRRLNIRRRWASNKAGPRLRAGRDESLELHGEARSIAVDHQAIPYPGQATRTLSKGSCADGI
jgi:hypothetical protein